MPGDQKDVSQVEGWFSQWEAVANRFENLTHQLADPTVLNQPSLLVSVNKERAELEKTSQLFYSHQALIQEIQNTQRMLSDSQLDPELREMAQEELQSLQGLQEGYQEKQALLGQLAVQRILMGQQMDALEARQTELETEYEAVQQEERDLVQKLNEKYGPGQLDPQTGVFTPTEAPAAPATTAN